MESVESQPAVLQLGRPQLCERGMGEGTLGAMGSRLALARSSHDVYVAGELGCLRGVAVSGIVHHARVVLVIRGSCADNAGAGS